MMGRSMLAYVPVNLASIVVSFGGLAVLTRLLGPEEYGRYALAMITMMFVHMGLFSWLEAAMARFQARAERDNDVNSHVKTLYQYAMLFATSGLTLCLFILIFVPISSPMKTVLSIAIASTCLHLFINLGMEAHKAAHRITRYSASYSVHLMLSFSIGIALILFSPLREAAPFVGMLISSLIILRFDLPFMLKQMDGGQRQDIKAKTYFKYGMPISVSLLLTYALSSGDLYIIIALLGDAAAGEYSASYNFANRSLDVLFIWLGMAVTPIAVTALEKDGVEKSQEIMRDYGAALLWVAMPAAVGIALVSKEAGFILGESVRDGAVKIMPLIALAGVLNGMISYYAHRAFMLSGKTAMFVWAMVPPVILNIVLNFILIPRFGLMGAVYATVAAYALGLVISLALGRRYYPLPLPVKAFVQISIACGAMALVVIPINLPAATPDFIAIIIKGSVGAIAYISVCLALNAANCRTLLNGLIDMMKTRAAAKKSNPIKAADVIEATS